MYALPPPFQSGKRKRKRGAAKKKAAKQVMTFKSVIGMAGFDLSSNFCIRTCEIKNCGTKNWFFMGLCSKQ